jgi:serine/threonine-protein kinase
VTAAFPSIADLPPDAGRRLESVCRRFEDAWRAGGRPGIGDHLAEVPQAERAVLLRELVALDVAYRRRLGEAPTPVEYLGRFPTDEGAVAAAFPADPGGPGPPRAVGRFSVLRLHATGGLGEVYVSRDEELGREVALKRIQDRYADQETTRARFLMEAEVTARLEHPGVVPVYGLVRDDAGRPCYAMRFVRGETLAHEARLFHDDIGRRPGERQLAFRHLLQRFIGACQAVAYAHSRGVVHRDLKPQNVMLGAFGETLVIDWGLAKPVGRSEEQRVAGEETLRPDAAGGVDATRTGAAVGTPAYMSPEQAAGRWDVVGPAADVYSLGATLYHLLTGRAPVRGENLAELRQKVQQGDYPSPREANPGVPKALEAVCRRAMALKPEDRYASAADLAADVERWLADEPVSAYREPLRARARRWLRRHRGLTITGAGGVVVAVAALAVGLVLAEVQKRETERAWQTASRERDDARGQRRLTRAALDDMLSEEALGWLTTQRHLLPEQRAFLERALKYYEGFAAEAADGGDGQDEVATAHYRVGRILHALGRRAEAEGHYRQALAQRERLAAGGPPDSRHQQELAKIHQNLGGVLDGLGRAAEAEAECRRALALWGRLAAERPDAPEYRWRMAQAGEGLGGVFRGLRRSADAEGQYRASLKLWESLAAERPDEPEFRQGQARANYDLGTVLASLGRSAEGIAACRRAMALWERLAAERPESAEYRSQLGLTRLHLGLLLARTSRLAEAEEQCRLALALLEHLAGDFPGVPGYRRELARGHAGLAGVLSGLGRAADAAGEYRLALSLWERLAAEHPDEPEYRRGQADAHDGHAVVLAGQGRAADAAGQYRLALKVWERLAAGQPGKPQYRAGEAEARAGLSVALLGLGRAAEAEAECRRALALWERLAAERPDAPEYRWRMAQAGDTLGQALLQLGRRAEAEAEHRRALPLWERLAADETEVPMYRVSLAARYTNLGDLVGDAGRAQEALEWYGRAIERLGPVRAREPREVLARRYLQAALTGRASILTELGRFTEAVSDWDRALELEEGPGRSTVRLLRARTLARAGDHARATAEAEELSAGKEVGGAVLYSAACLYALSAGSGPPDPKRRDGHAARAILLLRRAQAAGYFQSATSVESLAKEPDLAGLRARPDFQALLKEVGTAGH